MQGLIGYKIGMTRIFSENNISVPITVIKIEENRVTQIKFHNDHGYDAIQVTTGQKKK